MILFVALCPIIGSARNAAVPASNYAPAQGAPFFLLSDASYGSDENAQVRVEASGRGGADEGIDIVLYRVPEPMTFLRKQKNLHRLQIPGRYAGEGLANTLNYLWDSWYKQSRLSWQRILAADTRKKATEAAPQLKSGKFVADPSRFEQPPQFSPLPGFTLIDRFRYPLWQAKAIAPPKDLKLDGSSSDFILPTSGNVMVPLGKQKPGLYLVEAMLGSHRATTLVFVTDTIAITKNAGEEMLVWTANRRNGKPVAGAKIAWTDGLGVLQSGVSAADGVTRLRHASPERTYVLGETPDGGVFVSENFYYDSEIYNAKLYAVTDRPLYRPGDEVNVKFVGREFINARSSKPLLAGDIRLEVLDPSGTPIASQTLAYDPQAGGDSRFRLPANSQSGGYDLRFSLRGEQYGAAFRVAEYIKPHFEMNLQLDKPAYKQGEAVQGRVELRYPDGKPVADAHVELSLRAQQVTMVEGELQYAGLFPIQLEKQQLRTGSDGNVRFTLPAAKEPSRYVLQLQANDGAAFRVKSSKEILIERGAGSYSITTPRRFSAPGEAVTFSFKPLAPTQARPSRYELIRLETQSRTSGTIAPNVDRLPLTLADPGSYTLLLKDEAGNLLGATSHWVAGAGLKALPGSVEIVLDKDRYQSGDTAEALITFPQEVDEALLTLERDKVEKHALLKGKSDWLTLSKIGPGQWKARIAVGADFAPNMTFSVLYVRDGDYVFQNAGIRVVQPTLDIAIKTDKPSYRPGDTVTIDIDTRLDNKAVEAQLSLGVVDEMVYVLQPEIAPSIVDFFYHPRRNNVRTAASLSFITYDMAASGRSGAPPASNYNQRAVKVLERPRRDETDTAAWQGRLKTGPDGHLRFTFVMPDSLTRWRITARAIASNGLVGQKTASILSDKPLYLKWSGPARFRSGDTPELSLIVFNRAQQTQQAEFSASGPGLTETPQALTLQPGINFVKLPLRNPQSGVVNTQIKLAGTVVDRLATRIEVDPAGWLSPRSLSLPLTGTSTPLNLPADASNLRLALTGSAASQFLRVADELIDYPYGCIEQTASRLIPLSLALNSLGAAAGSETTHLLQAQRLRLVQLAGRNGVFGWWGADSSESVLLTGYAFYADWLASRSLGLTLESEHWQRLLELYSKQADQTPLLHRALVLWWANEMELPVPTLASALAEQALKAEPAKAASLPASTSVVFAAPDSAAAQTMTLLLLADLYQRNKMAQPPALAAAIKAAQQTAATSSQPSLQALALLSSGNKTANVGALLAQVSSEMPTLERALTLAWLHKALGGMVRVDANKVQPAAPWQAVASRLGTNWQWPLGTPLPGKLEVAASENLNAVLRYDSSSAESSKLPITVQRKLYVLEEGKEKLAFTATALKDGAALESDKLYVDEITLSPSSGIYRYGLLEVPLPPGAEVESTTWGMKIDGFPKDNKDDTGLRRVNHEMGRLSYHLPVELLDKPQTLRQLVRFSQKGRFSVPPTRYFRMYQPEDKALENTGKGNRVMEVR